ncbi:hypothetical protein MROS_2521 [Melioribacter roseus P3M-2]|jgi:hypothetical protein|uniref:Uncharacterized protein n=1 Tax=Melioribacter roseus (strain DSM 23840 / JCM 17771 / VKM B-2668 / P3M-2) TaxID=1191523 RepID=I7A788_MELRP|nr:hypothetical protein [Melioribacter roseus]AFN75751.1 hypothetical protein MROS_2521 [Melioribacter roseus P3M-2]
MNGVTIGFSGFKNDSDFLTSVAGLIPVVGDLIGGLFSSEDKGYWQGDKFIPGDLTNRINQINEWIKQYGLSWSDVDTKKIESYIYVPAGWQDNIKNYLQTIKAQKQTSGKSNIPESDSAIPYYNPQNIYNEASSIPGRTNSGLDVLPYLVLGGVGLYFLIKK